MVDVISFQDALKHSKKFGKRILLLGNGFSIACKPNIFNYNALYDCADFDQYPEVEKVFTVLKTQDFEIAIRSLENSSKITPIYTGGTKASKRMKEHAAALKNLLVETIAGSHPANPGDVTEKQFAACREFLSNFLHPADKGCVYTLNYDLLLYWTLMHDDDPFGILNELNTTDGFGEDQDVDDADYVVWQAESRANEQRVFHLHGALHLFDSGAELKKYTWNRKGIPLIDQAREAIEKDMYPLFVAEGTNSQKLAKIRHSAYLEHAYKSFSTNVSMARAKPSLFIYGHSLADNDMHVLKKIGRGSVPCVYISLYGDPNSDANKVIRRNAKKIQNMRHPSKPLEIKYFDAGSAKVWG